MFDQIIYRIFANQWLVLGIFGLVLLASAECGYRAGLRLHRSRDEARKGQISSIQGAVLGLLALLLGFTFSMAIGRYENRRSLVLEEANSIGTTYLRASLLPAAQRATVENLLRSYVGTRLEFYESGTDTTQRQTSYAESTQLQGELWAQAIAASQIAPTPITATFITTLNETIDLDAALTNALRTHVPGAVWLLLFLVAGAGCFSSGYATGSNGVRFTFSNVMLPLLIAVVITLVADLDRPRGGLIQINQQPLFDLQKSIALPK